MLLLWHLCACSFFVRFLFLPPTRSRTWSWRASRRSSRSSRVSSTTSTSSAATQLPRLPRKNSAAWRRPTKVRQQLLLPLPLLLSFRRETCPDTAALVEKPPRFPIPRGINSPSKYIVETPPRVSKNERKQVWGSGHGVFL